jgi:hypothetical protein
MRVALQATIIYLLRRLHELQKRYELRLEAGSTRSYMHLLQDKMRRYQLRCALPLFNPQNTSIRQSCRLHLHYYHVQRQIYGRVSSSGLHRPVQTLARTHLRDGAYLKLSTDLHPLAALLRLMLR